MLKTPKPKAHKAQALHRVQQHTMGFKKIYLNMPELVPEVKPATAALGREDVPKAP